MADLALATISHRKIGKPLIVNTDTSGNRGVHWIVMCRLKKGLYVFDPLGPRNQRLSSDYVPIDQLIMTADTHIYPWATQLKSSSACGWHSIAVASMIRDYVQSHHLATASELDTLIASKFGHRADKKDEKLVMAACATKQT